jgi:glutathione S-transferase
MLLIGQYDSPFVRRVGIALELYGLQYEHRSWSVWGNAEQIAAYNPLRRVPTLVLDDGVALVETFAILDTLDQMVEPERALIPQSGSSRRDGLHICALCGGFADKAVSLLYESLFRPEPSARWMERCRLQLLSTLELLERERRAHHSEYWFSSSISHADIALACSLRFVVDAHVSLLDLARYPALCALLERCEARPEFRLIYQPIVNNL